ncbi:MAG: hypothetical protein ACRCXT_24055 [Paraclostridium sp.]
MAIKDAIYQVDNGSTFDEIHFRTKAQQVTLQDSSNYFNSTNVEDAMKELFQNVSNGKSSIATAITDKGVATSASDTFTKMATNISLIRTGRREASGTTTYVNVSSNNGCWTVRGIEFTPSIVILIGRAKISSSYSNASTTCLMYKIGDKYNAFITKPSTSPTSSGYTVSTSGLLSKDSYTEDNPRSTIYAGFYTDGFQFATSTGPYDTNGAIYDWYAFE